MLETGIYTAFWDDILQRVDATNRSLQSSKLNLNAAVASLCSLKDFISSKRESFENYEKQGKELCGSSQTVIRQRRHNIRLQPLDYGRAEEAQLNSSLKFKIESFLPVIDQFIASLDQRLQSVPCNVKSIWPLWIPVNIIFRTHSDSSQDTSRFIPR